MAHGIPLARRLLWRYSQSSWHRSQRPRMTELEQKCIEAGLKMTTPRRVILQVLARSEDHPSVETVYERARELDTSISLATVYRTLNLLGELNLVRKHDFHESHARFEANVEHHHHLIDVQTGEVHEFQNARIEALIRRVADELGFELVDERLELYGRRKS